MLLKLLEKRRNNIQNTAQKQKKQTEKQMSQSVFKTLNKIIIKAKFQRLPST